MTPSSKTTSRRDFLVAGLGAAVGACALPAMGTRAALAAESASKPAGSAVKPNLRFGFTTFMWGSDLDIPALIETCGKTKARGVELRTQMKYAHGVELTLSAQERSDVKKRFADSPVTLVGIACSEQLD